MQGQLLATADGGCAFAASKSLGDGDIIESASLTKLNGQGVVQGSKSWVWTDPAYHDAVPILNAVEKITDGGYLLAGSRRGDQRARVAHAIKVSAQGNVVWSKDYSPTVQGEFSCLRATSDGAYLPCGTSEDHPYLVKVDGLVNTLWSMAIYEGPYQDVCSVSVMPNGGFFAAGTAYTLAKGGGARAVQGIVVCTDSQGIKLWSKTIGNDGMNGVCSLRPTSDGMFILGGTWQGGAEEGLDPYLVKMDANGNAPATPTIVDELAP